MKYIEEIDNGDCFEKNSEYFIITSDFKSNGNRLAIGLKDGYPKWFQPDNMVNTIDIFTLDKESNILAIKERKSDAKD